MSQTMNSKVSASWGQTVAYSKPALLALVMKFAMSGSECALTMSSLLDWTGLDWTGLALLAALALGRRVQCAVYGVQCTVCTRLLYS